MIYYAILKTGATVVPINILSTGREIAYYLKDCEAKAYFCFQGTPELPMAQNGFNGFEDVEECGLFWVMMADTTAPSPFPGIQTLAEFMAPQSDEFEMECTESDDTAVILYTSGTTGFPKGAELSHMNMTMNAVISREIMAFAPTDVQVISLPLFHSFGQTTQMNAGFSMGNTLVLIPRFSAEALFSALQNEKGTIFAGVPTMYWALLNYEDTENQFDMNEIAKNLRVGVSGGASLPLEILKGMEKKYKIPILEGYGLSETCPVASFNDLKYERKPGTVGPPIWGIDIEIVDAEDHILPAGEVGEVRIRGHNVMKGYYGKPAETAAAIRENGWFYTGDLGTMDQDGYLSIVDRLKDMIIRGGFNIYPREVEEVILSHPAVSLVSVLGVPHAKHGEEVMACIVLRENAMMTEQEMIAWCKEQMASYKYPRLIEFRSTLPMTATGKILKKELKSELTGNN
jgi:long-chain acyl-CoA synthetase